MFLKFRALASLPAFMRTRYFLTPDEKRLRNAYMRKMPRRGPPWCAIITVQTVEDYFYFALFAEITAAFREKGSIRVDQYVLRSLRPGSSASLSAWLWNLIGANHFSDLRWVRLYRSFADRTAWRATAWRAPWKEVAFYLQAWKIWRGLKSLEDLLALNIRGIELGDLIVDSYIRFKPAPAPELGDIYLFAIIRQALKDLDNAFGYFSRARPLLYLTSYTTYIQHGIAARVAVSLGVRVLSFGNYQSLAKEITSEDLSHAANTVGYKAIFASLPEQEAKLAVAENILSARMRGDLDVSTYYMKTSAYSDRGGLEMDLTDMPVIFLHDFFDSVHVYRWIVFHDFWKWVCFTIETFQHDGVNFAIKPHPNQVSDSNDVVAQLRAKYPDLKVIPVKTSNQALIDAGMACAITVYGTIASEMAFRGIPSISCGDNPHIAFDFAHTARTVDEYQGLLRNFRTLPRATLKDRQESCAFYYMHNLALPEAERRIRDASLELRRLLAGEPPPAPVILESFARLSALPEFKAFCDKLIASVP